MRSKEKNNKSILKYILYAILIELGTVLLSVFCFICGFEKAYRGHGGEIEAYIAFYIIPFLPILFLFKNFEKIEWRIISLGLFLINFLLVISLN
ncbi:MAG: hypothetical protein IKQ99_03590 [Alphaproteobacteria bacterium]|nr:hypothetical protein [Alphaproteobacteria bacterium]